MTRQTFIISFYFVWEWCSHFYLLNVYASDVEIYRVPYCLTSLSLLVIERIRFRMWKYIDKTCLIWFRFLVDSKQFTFGSRIPNSSTEIFSMGGDLEDESVCYIFKTHKESKDQKRRWRPSLQIYCMWNVNRFDVNRNRNAQKISEGDCAMRRFFVSRIFIFCSFFFDLFLRVFQSHSHLITTLYNTISLTT